jgi:hypothetical protein
MQDTTKPSTDLSKGTTMGRRIKATAEKAIQVTMSVLYLKYLPKKISMN